MPTNYRTLQDLAATRERVYDLASRHGGAFRRSDLPAWGVDEAVLLPMQRRRWWIRLHHGVYVDARLLDTPSDSAERHLVTCAAHIRALPGATYAFGSTAAAVHGLPMQQGLLSQVQLLRSVDSDGRAFRRRISAADALEPALIRGRTVPADQITEVHGIPTVYRPLAALSTAALSEREWALATLDADAWQRPGAADELAALAEQWSHLRGIGMVRQVVPLVRTGAQTPLESISRIRLMDGGLPEPQLQVPFHDRRGLIGYVDMYWPALGVVGEADGLQKYDGRTVLLLEKEREDRIRALGLIVVRWTWKEIMRDPGRVVARVLESAALARRRTG
jgi:hypothetical protein